MPLLPFKIGSSSRTEPGEERPSLIGGVLIGFLSIWIMSYSLDSMLGDGAPTKAEGGLFAPSNFLFFLLIESMVGVAAALVTLRMDGPGALSRLAIVVVLGGMVISALASDMPDTIVSARFIFARELLHAGGVLAVLRLARRKVSGSRSGERTAEDILRHRFVGLDLESEQRDRS